MFIVKVCLWASTAFAACSVGTRVHYLRSDDRMHADSNRPQRFQSRVSSMFGTSAATGQSATSAAFPYRFVFPANHPALHAAAPTYTHFAHHQQHHQPQQAELPQYSTSDEDLFQAKQTHDKRHQHHHQLPQQQQHQHAAYESVGRPQYEFLAGGHKQPHHASPYMQFKQPKHYQSFELAPGPSQYPSAAAAAVSQPIMLLIPSSGQPGAPYQTLVLVPSGAASTPLSQSTGFPGFVQHQHQFSQAQNLVPQFLQPGFVTHPRGAAAPTMPLVTGFPSAFDGAAVAGGLGRFPGAQLFHRSHDTRPPPQQRQQLLHRQQHKASAPPTSSYQGSGSAHVPHTTPTSQPLQNKISHGDTGASAENPDDRVDTSAETSAETTKPSATADEKPPEFGDKTNAKSSAKRIVVAEQ